MCLLLSPALYQKADESNGLYGFVGRDIVKEQKRICKQRCSYCLKSHANFSCVIRECKRSFHVKCGLKKGCQYRLTDFQTFCKDHRNLQKENRHANDELCAICCDSMEEFQFNESIYANCCKESWYHKRCLTEMSDKAGYFFCCPLCKNEEAFRKQVMEQGIFVPDRDAAWELEPNAFVEQLERPSVCCAKQCLCKKGRKFSSVDWYFVYCHACGGQGIHNLCWNSDSPFICNTCSEMGANSLLVDTLFATKDTLNEKSQELLVQMTPCSVKIHDVRDSHMVQKLSKKYFSGKWIKLEKLRNFQTQTTSSTQKSITSFFKSSSTETDDTSSPLRIPISRKRKRESHTFCKITTIFHENPQYVSAEVAAQILRKRFLDDTTDDDSQVVSISSTESINENQPPSNVLKKEKNDDMPKPKRTKQLSIDSFFNRNMNVLRRI